LVSNLADDRHALQGLVEWDLQQFLFVQISLDQFIRHIVLVVEQELNHSDFKRLALGLVHELVVVVLDPHVGVRDDAVLDQLF
jgi:hypothetical protein